MPFAIVQAASAERRVALVIGNASYGHHPRLPNVPNDAAAMASLLKAAKFDGRRGQISCTGAGCTMPAG